MKAILALALLSFFITGASAGQAMMAVPGEAVANFMPYDWCGTGSDDGFAGEPYL